MPGRIEAENYDHGAAGVAYLDLTAGNSGGAYRTDDVDIEPVHGSATDYNVGWMFAGEWLHTTIAVGAAGSYALEAGVASNGGGGTFHLEVNGSPATGPISIPDTGGWQQWQTVTTTVTLEAGIQRLRVVLDTNGTSGAVGNLNYLWLTPSSASPDPSAPFGGAPIAVPGRIEAENYDHGAAGVAYLDMTAGNSGGEYRSDDVDIERVAGSTDDYNVGWMFAGEWLQYTIAVGAAGSYALEAGVASNGGGGTFHLEVNGSPTTGPISIPDTGGWQQWQTISTTVTLEAGVQRLRVVLDTNGTSGAVGNLNYLKLTPEIRDRDRSSRGRSVSSLDTRLERCRKPTALRSRTDPVQWCRGVLHFLEGKAHRSRPRAISRQWSVRPCGARRLSCGLPAAERALRSLGDGAAGPPPASRRPHRRSGRGARASGTHPVAAG